MLLVMNRENNCSEMSDGLRNVTLLPENFLIFNFLITAGISYYINFRYTA